MKDTPEIDELVIIRIRKIYPYGAFCELEEYPGREGFVHLSEVASRWVKNIHNFLKEGQRTVGRVYRIIPEKNLIDVSLRRATEGDVKLKMEQFRREKRGGKLLEVASADVKKSKMSLAEASELLRREYGDILSGFEEASAKGESALEKAGMPVEWASAITEVARKNIKKQKKRVSGIFTMSTTAPNGIEIITEALEIMAEKGGEVTYLGAPRYMINVEAEDYKRCEKKLKAMVDAVAQHMKSHDGTCAFEKREE